MLARLRRLAGRRWFQRWMAFNAGTVGAFLGLWAALFGGIAVEAVHWLPPNSKGMTTYHVELFGFRPPPISTEGKDDSFIWGCVFVVVPTVLFHGVARRVLSFVRRRVSHPLLTDDGDCLKGFSPSRSPIGEAKKDDPRIIAG
jgi:hypothetical protein